MKYISSALASVALYVSADDVRPVRGILTRDLIAAITSKYKFHVYPTLPPGFPPQALPAMVFQSGLCDIDGNQYPIMNLAITGAATTITAYDSDACDAILDDYVTLLDDTLKYRIKNAPQRRAYQSNVVVEFDPGLEKLISQFAVIEDILNNEVHRDEYPFKIKRLSFGYGDPDPVVMLAQNAAQIERSDFQIERRAQEPYDRNRYFCAAPVRTGEHIQLLERIDRALATKGAMSEN